MAKARSGACGSLLGGMVDAVGLKPTLKGYRFESGSGQTLYISFHFLGIARPLAIFLLLLASTPLITIVAGLIVLVHTPCGSVTAYVSLTVSGADSDAKTLVPAFFSVPTV